MGDVLCLNVLEGFFSEQSRTRSTRGNLIGMFVLVLVLMLVFVLIEVSAARYIGQHGQPRAVVTMIVMALMGLVMGIPSVLILVGRAQEDVISGISSWLMVANWLMLITIAIHDFDHMRQAVGWDYTFTTSLLVVNCGVYVPGFLGVCLASMSTLAGAIATMVGSAVVVIAFLLIHFLGTSWKVWGPWCKPFWELGVDRTSWTILWATATVGLIASAFGGVALGLSM